MTATKPAPDVDGGTDSHDDGTIAGSKMWTSRLRRAWMSKLPPDKLLPDRQPAYLASWIYVFGVLTLAAFLVIIVSGLALAFAGPPWYHTSSLGHFTNSLHFWSVQLFFVFMVIHLCGDGSYLKNAATAAHPQGNTWRDYYRSQSHKTRAT